ncbi:MAG: NCS2 family permease [Dictyoglomus thermophilum]|uniref:NCS2 family permease n=1 Tax=Dictyoglomus thermophilum TaxID=14 RepID=A0A7V4DY86_DICTH|nr:NCS2 family permease [Dictyoglomus thermophilum]MCX7719846.1 NCS2 family permease [Dictyoglomus thermophilum]TYT22701.1 NCS2 family permease [Dictyoglomus thermophilum]
MFQALAKYFGFKEKGTSWSNEIIAGLTTFVTMAYILFVNPNILGDAGMPKSAVLMATAIGAGIATLTMGLYAKLPFALAPGMGLNAYFAYSVCQGLGLPWQVALGAVFIDGLIFLILSILPVRKWIVQSIPLNIKLATSVGIGLFIALIGLKSAGIVVKSDATLVTLGSLKTPETLLSIFGIIVIALLMALNVKGNILIGILITTIVGAFIKGSNGEYITHFTGNIIALPNWSEFSKTFLALDILGALKWGFFSIIFTFTFVDMFDTVGTISGLASKLNILKEDGSFEGAERALVSDAVGTIAGALCGTSTITTYIESASGIAEGGKTGAVSLITGLLFLLSIVFWPLAGIIPSAATAPALVIVGFLMMEPILKVNFKDVSEALPAFITIVAMPFTYSVANGLILGILSYVLLKLLTGKIKELNPVLIVLSILFILYFIL